MARKLPRLLTLCLLAIISELGPGHSQTGSKIGMLLAAGDITWCPTKKKGTSKAKETAAIIREQINNASVPVRVLALGDLAYDAGQTEDLKCFAGDWKDFKDKLIAVPGNHEYDSLEEKDGKPTKDRRPTHDAAPFFDHFKNYAFVRRCDEKDVLTNERLPEDECAKRWYKKGYFAFNFPDSGSPWRIVALNDNLAGPRLKAQTQWLEQQLDIAKGNDQRCVLAFWHAPVFSSGQHGHKDYRHPRPKAKLSAPGRMQGTLGILHRHGGSVVLQAHDHDYEQFNPHDSAGRPASDGIRSFVIGTGGAGLTKDFYVPEGWAATSDRGPFGHDRGRHGVLKIDLYQDGYSWEFLQVETHGRRDIPGGPPFVPCNQRKTPPANAPSPR